MVGDSSSGAVLVVEDDAAVRSAIADGLAVNGFTVDAVHSAESALDELRRSMPDVIVLDVGLPGMSGIELCSMLREREINVPILVLSARDEVGDRVAGLQAGADDYLVKPFDLTELVARLHALRRRAGAVAVGSTTTAGISIGPLRVDPERRIADTATARLDLTRREFDLLLTLAENHRVVLTRTQLLELVWGYDFEVETNVVDVFVGYLRKKMDAAGLPRLIKTVRGVGFVLEDA